MLAPPSSGPVPVMLAQLSSGPVPVMLAPLSSGPVPVMLAQLSSGPIPVMLAPLSSGPVPAMFLASSGVSADHNPVPPPPPPKNNNNINTSGGKAEEVPPHLSARLHHILLKLTAHEGLKLIFGRQVLCTSCRSIQVSKSDSTQGKQTGSGWK